MATTLTFSSLQTDVQRYLERGSTAAADPLVFDQIPRLINLAERRIATELKIQGFIRVLTTTLVPGTSVYAKPDRWRDTVSMNIGTGPSHTARAAVLPRAYEFVRAYCPDESVTGTPDVYADYDFNHWLLAPTPDAAYPMEVLYYEQLQLLDDENQINWLTESAPQLLLYATLLEATPFLKNDERIGTWQTMYDRAAEALNGQDLSKILDRASVRKAA